MTDTVRVQFSASIGALIKGVEDAKSAIESVKESTDKVTAGAKSLLEAFGIAFSTDKLVEMIGQMAELGEQVERSKAILGTSTKSVQELGFIAKMTGGDAEGLSLAMERLQVNLQKAQSGAGPAYQALQALGLSAKQLSSVTLDQQLNKIANAFAKFGDGPNKTAIAIELLGRAGAQMIPVLDQGSEGLEKLRASADNSGAVLSRTAVDSLSALERSLVGLKAAVTGVAGALTAELAPALTRVITGTTELIGGVNVAIQTHTVWEREIIAITTGARELGQVMANLGTMVKDVFTFKWGDVDANWAKIAADRQAGLDRVAAIQKEGDDKINAIAKQAAVDLQKILGGEPGAMKPPPPSSAAPNNQGFADQIKALNEKIQIQNQAYQSEVEQINSAAKTYQLTEQEKTQALIVAVRTRVSAVDGWIRHEIAQYQKAGKSFEALTTEQEKNARKGAENIQKIQDQATQQYVKDWQNVLTPIQSAWDSQLKGLLSHTETWGTAMKRIFQDLVMDAIKRLETLAVEKAAAGLTSLTNAATGGAGGGPASLFGALLGGGGSAAATALNTTALGLNTTALGLLTTAMGGGAAAAGAGAIGGAAGAAGDSGGLFSGFKSLLSMFGIVVPGAEVGGYVLGGGLAMIHAGETITPANVATPYAGPGGSSGGAVTHVHNWMAWDGPSVQSWLTRGGTDQIARAMAAYGPLHPSTQ